MKNLKEVIPGGSNLHLVNLVETMEASFDTVLNKTGNSIARSEQLQLCTELLQAQLARTDCPPGIVSAVLEEFIGSPGISPAELSQCISSKYNHIEEINRVAIFMEELSHNLNAIMAEEKQNSNDNAKSLYAEFLEQWGQVNLDLKTREVVHQRSMANIYGFMNKKIREALCSPGSTALRAALMQLEEDIAQIEERALTRLPVSSLRHSLSLALENNGIDKLGEAEEKQREEQPAEEAWLTKELTYKDIFSQEDLARHSTQFETLADRSLDDDEEIGWLSKEKTGGIVANIKLSPEFRLIDFYNIVVTQTLLNIVAKRPTITKLFINPELSYREYALLQLGETVALLPQLTELHFKGLIIDLGVDQHTHTRIIEPGFTGFIEQLNESISLKTLVLTYDFLPNHLKALGQLVQKNQILQHLSLINGRGYIALQPSDLKTFFAELEVNQSIEELVMLDFPGMNDDILLVLAQMLDKFKRLWIKSDSITAEGAERFYSVVVLNMSAFDVKISGYNIPEDLTEKIQKEARKKKAFSEALKDCFLAAPSLATTALQRLICSYLHPTRFKSVDFFPPLSSKRKNDSEPASAPKQHKRAKKSFFPSPQVDNTRNSQNDEQPKNTSSRYNPANPVDF
jgi:hypothetical protein